VVLEEAVLRSLERILVVAGAIVSIVLGYRLFHNIPFDREANGKISLPGGVEIMLAKIGPGAFFALFGSIVLGVSLYSDVTVEEQAPPTAAAQGSQQAAAAMTTRTYVGISPAGLNDQQARRDLAAARTRLLPDIAFLNSLDSEPFNAGLSNDLSETLRRRVRDLKLALLEPYWTEELGDWIEFRDWVLDHPDATAPPENLKEAVALFNHGGDFQ